MEIRFKIGIVLQSIAFICACASCSVIAIALIGTVWMVSYYRLYRLYKKEAEFYKDYIQWMSERNA